MKKLTLILSILVLAFFKSQTNELWGMTRQGANNSNGVIFSYNPNTNVYTKKMEFNGSNGSQPYGSLTQASNGKLYGLTSSGGSNFSGTLFEYNPLSNVFNKKIDFNGAEKGTEPLGSLVESVNGMLYGFTVSGGKDNYGVIFEYNPANHNYNVVHQFDGSNGKYPYGSILEASNGKFYGMTKSGGAVDYGVFFEYDKKNNIYTKLDLRDINARSPEGSLIQAKNGKIYGMASGGDYGFGVIFEYDILNKTLVKKFNFDANFGTPYSTLTEASNGKLYGMTKSGGTTNYGILFEYDPVTNNCIIKFDFKNTTLGFFPYSTLTEVSPGKLYGLTYRGGDFDGGVLFEYNFNTNNYSKKFDFDFFTGNNPYYTKLIPVNFDLLSTLNLNKTNVVIYPNPVKNIVYINSSENVVKSEVYSIDGKLILSQEQNSILNIDVSKLSKGNYLLKLKTKNGEKQIKFIRD